MAGNKTYRINKVAAELNVGWKILLEHLSDKGMDVEQKITAKIDQSMYDVLYKDFQSDRRAKEESQSLDINVRKKDDVKIAERPVAAVKPKREEEEETVFIKDSGFHKKVEIEAPAAPKEVNVEPPAAQEPVVPPIIEKTELPGFKIIGKIDLDRKSSKPAPPPVEESKIEEKIEEKPIEEVVQPEVKVEIPAPVIETPPVQEPVVEKVEIKVEPEVVVETPAPAVEIPVLKEETPVIEKIEPVVPIAETTPEPEFDPLRETQYAKLKGLSIKGKIELPAEKKPVASSDAKGGDLANRKKRKRKPKTDGAGKPVSGANTNTGNATGTGTGATPAGPRKFEKRKPFERGPKKEEKGEITDKEIQDKIKATLAKLGGQKGPGGNNSRQKLRRQKRDDHRLNKEEEDAQKELESKILRVTEFVTANELASLMSVPVTGVITACMSLGMMVSINQRLDAETITVVADEFGFEVQFVDAETQVEIQEEIDDPKDLKDRPPIVTVMGHVDHGKTSLLDYIRSANVIAGESGGITQHVAAYEVTLANGKKITFVDTPGHEAFTAMRARGAKVTDLVIIVIAADDNVMPQTREAISHSQAAGVPIVFAFNKMDREGANADKIREELSKMNILVEEWGGKFQTQEISAKKGTGIESLLEKVLLEAEMLELKANPVKRPKGTVMEAEVALGRGISVSMLVQEGTLKIGDPMVAGHHFCRVRAMFNERDQQVQSAGPATPVKVLGFTSMPAAGDVFHVMAEESEAKEIANKRAQLQREQGIRATKHITLDEIGRRLAIGNFKELNVIIKGDVDGSVEALADALLKLSTEQIQVNVIHKSVGQISESDVLLASASDAIIIGFQVRPAQGARKLAETEQIDIRLYSVIYHAIEELKSAMEGMLSPEYEEKITGSAEIRDVFKITKVGAVAGCMLIEGKMQRDNKIRVIRDGVVVYTGELASLKRFKDDVKEVAKGYECGMQVKNYNDIRLGDILEGFHEVEIKRKSS
jgi:translation initiation factor IF-2